jgi:hypothetical protein
VITNVTRRRVVGRLDAAFDREEGGRTEGAVVERLVVVDDDPPGYEGCGGVSWGMGLGMGPGCVGMGPEMVWFMATTS